ncbi:hypothetical protein GCM10028777_16590 [Angustibacter speluncae]
MTAVLETDAVTSAPLEVAGVPVAVSRSLRLLRQVERERSSAAHRFADTRACDGLSGEQALAVVEASQAVAAWAESLSVEATRRMLEVFDADHDRFVSPAVDAQEDARRLDPLTRPERRAAEVRGLVTTEIACATGIGERAAGDLVSAAATDPVRLDPLLERTRRGEISWFRARKVLDRTAGIDVAELPEVYAAVLAPRRDGTPPSPTQLTDRLASVVKRLDPGCDERSRTSALRDRSAWVQPHDDGTAVLAASGDVGRCAAAYERVDAIARAIKASGHGAPLRGDGTPAGDEDQSSRTLAQLRSDVLVDLVLHGQVVVAGAGEQPAAPVGACDLPRLGELPPSTTHVTVALTTLLGLDDEPGRVRGAGAVTAAQARELATAAGSVWRRLVTDPLTRRAIGLDGRRYRPAPSVADDVRVRDGVCRGVGCTLDAFGCDADHVIAWEAGARTTADDLVSLHRRHHQRKTRGWWTSALEPDGTLTWTSPLGRSYTTEPATYGRPEPPPDDPPPY